ncbi:hypothetical protein [Undibacterium sp. TJN19]|uniref:hypothetical protein n=1 Tax=Undibacterium sp. TJN19 TaxID=3413055 RepID=UPI003BEF6CD1
MADAVVEKLVANLRSLVYVDGYPPSFGHHCRMDKNRLRIIVAVVLLVPGLLVLKAIFRRGDSVPAIPTEMATTTSQAAMNNPSVLLAPTTAEEEQGMQFAPEAEKFASDMVEGQAGLRKYLTATQAKQVTAMLKGQHCDSQKMTVYYQQAVAEKLLVSDCNYEIEAAYGNTPAYYDIEYNIMLAVSKDQIHELKNVRAYKFMYESGSLAAVTNLNKNGRLQLWLDGTVCENDNSQDMPAIANLNDPVAECEATTIVEIIDGKLLPFKKKALPEKLPGKAVN